MNNLITLTHTLIATTLILPLFSPQNRLPYNMKEAVKHSFLLSLIPTLFASPKMVEASFMQNEWLSMLVTFIKTAFQFDTYANIFLSVALFVTWNILEFSMWYMKDDPEVKTFFKYLVIFLLAMMLLVAASNMLSLFIGWEGVGLMSFLLIGWYHGRNNSAAAAVQAVLYNRIGDIGFFIIFCWMMKSSMLTNFDSIQLSNTPTPVLLASITAAASKSAQFGLHPWLASAMEGPTPVSALLHSSTMVVAGIFFLIRIYPIMANNQTALTACLCLGALSTMYAATSALMQNDMKKIVAYSTSSQLGLMMVAIGIGQPHFAFFHICTHAFFKAMLFLCSGLIIHNLNDEQDIRKMGGLLHVMPVTSTCLSIGSLALMGTPFLSGFYSKDSIIEAMNSSYINSTALFLTLMATAFTAVYTLRLILFILLGHPRTNPTMKINENDAQALNPVTRLAMGSIVAGLYIFYTVIPDIPITHTMPPHSKLAALMVTIMAFFFAWDLTKRMQYSPLTETSYKNFDPMFFNQIVHRTSVHKTFDVSWQVVTHLLETLVIKKIDSELPNYLTSKPTRIARATQSGIIKTYLSTLLITLLLTLIFVQFF
uniref:NADH-ubiquinone oxidoreductase chain 5 n=2 Tax=Buergeria buergeri TaxID=191197 RepID=Q6L7I8_BUEBU|nr:NADH dehydrogenase subunit 5 [Buergeria buergeri]